MQFWLSIAGVSGAAAVAMGAAGAHLAQSGSYAAELISKAAHYQIVHALALLGVAVLWQMGVARLWVRLAGFLFIAGTVFFSCALYTLALWSWPVQGFAPLGGMAFILGWLCLTVAGIRIVPSSA